MSVSIVELTFTAITVIATPVISNDIAIPVISNATTGITTQRHGQHP